MTKHCQTTLWQSINQTTLWQSINQYNSLTHHYKKQDTNIFIG